MLKIVNGLLLASTMSLLLTACVLQNSIPESKLVPQEVVIGDFVLIPSGSFTMGSNKYGEHEHPEHTATVAAFYMQTHEVTWDQYQPCITAQVCKNVDDQGWGKGNRPIINVSWNDVQNYINWLNKQTDDTFRLPTEAEWEYAARGGSNSNTKYPWGESIDCSQAHYGRQYYSEDYECNDVSAKTMPVKEYQANGYGLYDMQGNVWEWQQDCWSPYYYYKIKDIDDWRDCSQHMLRGGSWLNDGELLRITNRVKNWNEREHESIGFRLVREHKE